MNPWILGMWLMSAPASEWQLIERVVAVVDDDVVLASELERRLEIARVGLAKLSDAERARHAKDLRSNLLRSLVDERLIALGAARLDLTVDDSEIDRAIAQIRTANNLDDAALTRALADSGWTMPEYRSDVGRQLLRFRLFTTIFSARLTIPEEAMQAAYAAEKAKNPALGEYADVSSRLRDDLRERILNEEADRWLIEARSNTHVELRP